MASVHRRPARRRHDEELFCIPSQQGSGSYLTRAMIVSCVSDLIPVIRALRADDAFNEKSDSYRFPVVEGVVREQPCPVADRAQPSSARTSPRPET